MKSAIWSLFKVAFFTLLLWAPVVAGLSLAASLGWNAFALPRSLPAVEFASAFGAIGAMCSIVYAVRFAASSPLITAEVEKEYRGRTVISRTVIFSAIFWPPRS